MSTLNVGPTSTYPTIAAAMAAAVASDTILLEAGYSNETATITHPGMIISGEATSTGITLQLGSGIATLFLAGTAPINVLDNPAGGNGIDGNDGDNVVTVTGGADAVSGGLGTDRLVVDYHLTTGAVTGNSTTNVADAGGLGIVTINGGFENFTILTGSGDDTITTGAGDDIINTGEGASTVTAGAGANRITGGSGADTITALDGGNFIDGGDGANTITSGDGNDVITGGLGADTIVAGGGDDFITVRGGADTSASGPGNDRLIVDYSAFNTAVTGGVTGGDLLNGYSGHIADLAGDSIDFDSTENFTITTGSGNDVITTGDGIDVLSGGAGNDLLDGSGGVDVLTGGLGNDTLIGGAGDDTINYAVGDGADAINSGADNDTLAITGSVGNDLINVVLTGGIVSGLAGGTVTNIEHVTLALDGGSGDTLDYTGTTGPVAVNLSVPSATGFDSISGVENVVGGSGGDTLIGDGNANVLTGGGGNDVLDGGGGTDTAVYTGARSDYTINALSQATIQLIDNRSLSPNGSDTIANIEFVQFSDQTVAVNSAPVLANLGPPATGTEQTFALLDSDVSIADAELDALNASAGNYAGASATIMRSGGNNPEDDFSFDLSGASFTLSGNNLQSGGLTFATFGNAGGTQTITFTSSGTAATTSLVNDVLRHVTYANQSDNPPANVTLDYTFNDGQATLLGGARSATQSLTVNIGEVNDAPSAANDALSAIAEDSGQRTILGSALTGNDSAGPVSESGQTLTVTGVGNVVGGSASVSGGNVLFTPAANFNGAASFDYTVTDDGTTNGVADPLTATATASFMVTEINDASSATNDALSAIAEDSGQRTILGSVLTGNDSAGPASESGQTLTVTGVANVIGGSASVSGGNVLFTPAANFNGAASFDYTVTDNGTANGVPAPLTATATASFTVNAVNGAPVFVGLDNTPSFTEGGAAAVLDNNAAVIDADLGSNDPVLGATLTLARVGGASSDDLFASSMFDENQVISQISGLVAGFFILADGTLTVTFNTNAVFADVTDVVRSLTYVNASDAPPGSAQIGYLFDNGEQATGSITVGIAAVNDPPSIDGTAPAFYQPGSAGVVLSPAIALADVDSATLVGASVSLNAHDPTDLLSVDVGSSGIVAIYDASTGVLGLSGAASLDAYRQVLEAVTYSSSVADPTVFGLTRTITWLVSDGIDATTVDSALSFTPTIDLDQSVAGTGFATLFTEGGAAVAIADTDDHITASSTSIGSATVVLTNAKPGDTLSAPGASIASTVDQSVPGQITLTFTGSGNYEAALHQVVFGSASANIDPETRDITVVVTDANNTSNTAHATIMVSATNNPGSATNDSATTAEDTGLTVAAAQGVLANDNDPDGLAVITGSVATSHGGLIQFAGDGSYTYMPAANFSGIDTVGYTAQDPFGSQVSATLAIDVMPANDAPVITSNGGGDSGTLSVAENTTAVTTVVAADVDGPSTTFSIAGGADAGKFQINAATGVLSFITAPDFEAPGDTDHNNSYLVQVRASDGSLDDNQAITISVTDAPEQIRGDTGPFQGGATFDFFAFLQHFSDSMPQFGGSGFGTPLVDAGALWTLPPIATVPVNPFDAFFGFSTPYDPFSAFDFHLPPMPGLDSQGVIDHIGFGTPLAHF